MDQDVRLTIEISNRRPVELSDLARSLFAVAAEYRRHVVEFAPDSSAADVKLYVREIRSGSIIAELMAMSPYSLPIIEHAQTIIEYAQRLKALLTWVLGKSEQKPEAVKKETLQSLAHILEPVARDNGAQMNIGAVNIQGNVVVNLRIDSVEANAAQNRIAREIEALKAPVTGLHEQVVLYWVQARNQIDTSPGDRARIESVYDGDVKVRFANDQLKAAMLFEPDHPFALAFVVDVQVETINDKPILYKVLRLHETLPRPTAGTNAPLEIFPQRRHSQTLKRSGAMPR